MANLPVRKLGAIGIVKDVSAFDLPIGAWSGGRNVVFMAGKARRAPGFRLLQDINSTIPTPAAIFALRPTSGTDDIYVAENGGTIHRFAYGTGLTDVTDVSFTPGSATTQFTSATLSGLLYFNRETHPIRYLNPGTGAVEDLPNWPSNYRAGLIRSYKDFLMAFAITKGGAEYNSTFKWSNATLAGQTPDNWDPSVIENNLAGETTLAEMDSAIIDAQQLRDMMVVYGTTQVWAVEYTGDRMFPFAQRKLFNEGGIISRNCVVEVNGRHFVFGSDDLYVHDGVEKRSIAGGLVRDFVFRTMNRSQWQRFYVHHDRVNRLIMFCYVSQDDDVAFPDTTYPNKAAVFAYEDNTWGFMELPNVCGMVTASAALTPTWASVTDTWESLGGTWADLEDGQKDATIVVCQPAGAVTTARVLAVDGIDRASRIIAPLDDDATSTAYLERTGIDLDDVENLPLNTFKVADVIRPQVRTFSEGVSLDVSVGASEFQQEPPTYDVTQTFDPDGDISVDAFVSGRYLSIKMEMTTPNDFHLSGMDVEVGVNGSI